jgi:hypothetical protein
MIHEILKTENYLLILDNVDSGDEKFPGWWYNSRKVLFHLPLGKSSIVKNVELLPHIEIDSDGKYPTKYDSRERKYIY